MSFSGNVKEELAKYMTRAKHCQSAELAAIIILNGKITISARDHYSIRIQTDSVWVARKCFTLITKTFRIRVDVSVRMNSGNKNSTYSLFVRRHEDAVCILQAIKLVDENRGFANDFSMMHSGMVAKECCKYAFLRGAFLTSGSMSDPKGSYHLEYVCSIKEQAEQIQDIMKVLSYNPKIVKRKKYYVVYLKEGDQIVHVLGMMGASGALLELENIRIYKEMRNSVNRKVNCETANLNKTVSAAVKQLEDIRLIESVMGLEKLPDTLQEIAILRLENQDATLQELSMMLSYPIGKSGVNHRLRKISGIADRLRQTREA